MEPILKSSHSGLVLLGCEPVSGIRVGQLLELLAAQPACLSQPPEPPAWTERRAGCQLESELACERKRWPLPESLLTLCRGSSQLDVHPTLLLPEAPSQLFLPQTMRSWWGGAVLHASVGPLGAQAVYQVSNIASSVKNQRLRNQVGLVDLCAFT